jgi:hypothetical protein
MAQGKEGGGKEDFSFFAGEGPGKFVEEIKAEETFFQKTRAKAGEDHHHPARGVRGRLNPGGGRTVHQGRKQGKDRSDEDESGKSGEQGQPLPGTGPLQGPRGEAPFFQDEIPEERGGGQGVEQETIQLHRCGKGNEVPRRAAGKKTGEKKDKIEDQGLKKAEQGILLLTVFSLWAILDYVIL